MGGKTQYLYRREIDARFWPTPVRENNNGSHHSYLSDSPHTSFLRLLRFDLACCAALPTADQTTTQRAASGETKGVKRSDASPGQSNAGPSQDSPRGNRAARPSAERALRTHRRRPDFSRFLQAGFLETKTIPAHTLFNLKSKPLSTRLQDPKTAIIPCDYLLPVDVCSTTRRRPNGPFRLLAPASSSKVAARLPVPMTDSAW